MSIDKKIILRIGAALMATLVVTISLILYVVMGLTISISNKTTRAIYDINIYCSGEAIKITRIDPNSKVNVHPTVIRDGTISLDWKIDAKNYGSDIEYYVTTGGADVLYINIEPSSTGSAVAAVMHKSYFEPLTKNPIRVYPKSR